MKHLKIAVATTLLFTGAVAVAQNTETNRMSMEKLELTQEWCTGQYEKYK